MVFSEEKSRFLQEYGCLYWRNISLKVKELAKNMATAITLKKSLEPTHVHVGAAAAARLHLAHLRKVGEQATTTGIHLSHVLLKASKPYV